MRDTTLLEPVEGIHSEFVVKFFVNVSRVIAPTANTIQKKCFRWEGRNCLSDIPQAGVDNPGLCRGDVLSCEFRIAKKELLRDIVYISGFQYDIVVEEVDKLTREGKERKFLTFCGNEVTVYRFLDNQAFTESHYIVFTRQALLNVTTIIT